MTGTVRDARQYIEVDVDKRLVIEPCAGYFTITTERKINDHWRFVDSAVVQSEDALKVPVWIEERSE